MFNVYIDDTSVSGNPCEVYSVNTNYKSYIAIFLEDKTALDARQKMPKLAEILKKEYGTDEFHFTDIYSGHGPYKKMSAAEKIDLFSAFSDLIYHYDVQWTVQSMSNESKDKLEKAFVQMKIENIPNILDIAELTLLMKKLNELVKNKIIPSENIDIACDNGIKKPGESLTLPDTEKIFAFPPIIHFKDSKKEPLLQLADFVAFCFLRSQIGVQKYLNNKPFDQSSFYYKLQEITSKVMMRCVSPDVIFNEINNNDTLESINSKAKMLLQKKKD